MTIAILSFFSGSHNRGVESWAENLKTKLTGQIEINILSGWSSYNPLLWKNYQVLIPTNGRSQVFVCRLFTWPFTKPMIVFGHSGLGADDKWNLLCSPDYFVSFSHFQNQWANKFKLPWTKTTVISHAVDTQIFTPAPKKPHQQIVLCVAAKFTDHKRTEALNNAAQLLPHIQTQFVGPGQPSEVPFDQMPTIYRQADIFCLVPQAWEAFGLVFLEAMSANLPVVTTDDPIRREIIGPAGIFVSHPEDPQELSQAITSALKKDWGNLPRVQAQKYSWEQIKKLYLDLFTSL